MEKQRFVKKIRDFDNKIAWISIDKVKNIFSDYEDRVMDEVNDAAVVILKSLLDKNYSVVIDGIFKNLKHYDDVVQIGKDKNVPVTVYQLECSLETLKRRDKERDGPRQGLWKPLGDELIESLYRKVEENPIEGVIKLNTEELSPDEIADIIRKDFSN